MSTDTAIDRQLTGRRVLLILVGFFAVVFAANGALMAFALSTNTGALGHNPYRSGLKYNERIAAAEKQAELGWTSDISIENGNHLVAVLRDRAGNPLSGLNTSATVGLAVSDRKDISSNMTEVSPGRYEMPLGDGEVGNLIADLDVRNSGSAEIVFRARRRLWLKP